MKWIAGILIAVFSPAATVAQTAASVPAWQDAAESYIGLAAQNQTDPVKQLELLKQWEQQYPNSAFQSQRKLLTASALLNIVGTALTDPAPAAQDAGQKAAQQLIDHFDSYFGPAVKPDGTSDAQWTAIRKTAELQARALLAQIAVTRKDDAEAEEQYKKILAIDPTQAAISYQLGLAILRQMAKGGTVIPARYSEALYDIARSLAVTGPNALAATGQTAAMNSLRKNYLNYHGDTSGMEDLIHQTASSALPPDDFHILSVVEMTAIQAAEHDKWATLHPDLNLWQTIRASLESKGDDYFTSSLKDVGLPPPPGDFGATVVSALSSKELLVSVDNAAGDARLKFDENIKGDIPAGTAIRFRGVVDSWTASPYVLTLAIQDPKADITGLPDTVTFVPDHTRPPAKPAKSTPR